MVIEIPRNFILWYLFGFANLAIGLFAPSWFNFVVGASQLAVSIGALIRLARIRDDILYLGLDLADFDLAPHSPWRTRARRGRR